MQRGQKKLFHLVIQCSRENASGEGKAVLVSLGNQQGIWCVLVTWKATAVVIGIKMPPCCPGPPTTHSGEAVALGYSTSCTLTVPSLQPTIFDESGTRISYQEVMQVLIVSFSTVLDFHCLKAKIIMLFLHCHSK